MAQAHNIWNPEFWKAAGERAIMTFAQTLIGLIGVDTVAPIQGLDWANLLSAALLAALVSALKSVSAGAATGGPSAGKLEAPNPKPKGKLKPWGTEQGM